MPRHRRRARQIDTKLLVILCLAFSCTAIFAAVQLAVGLNTYSRAGKEYDNLRIAYAPEPTPPITPAVLDESAGASVPVIEQIPAMEETVLTSAPVQTPKPNPSEVNPEYVGWLEIAGTNGGRLPGINYPVVQGEDNSKYLTTTFEGKENKLGAIFLDYRCAGAFDAPHAIIYGHNANDASMFGSLSDLLELDAEKWPDITITMPDGTALIYSIYAIRETDINDPAYRLDFEDNAQLSIFAAEMGAPDKVTRLLTLSTCADNGNKDNRLLVQAAVKAE